MNAPDETTKARQMSEDSESIYSQSTDSSDDDAATTMNADHQSTTTFNQHPGAPETAMQKADSLNKDDSDTNNPLEDMLLDLREVFNDEILKVAKMANSMGSLHHGAYQESLNEALNRVNHLTARREWHKKRTKDLETKNKTLQKEVDVSKEKANKLQTEMNAAREKAMGLFG